MGMGYRYVTQSGGGNVLGNKNAGGPTASGKAAFRFEPVESTKTDLNGEKWRGSGCGFEEKHP